MGPERQTWGGGRWSRTCRLLRYGGIEDDVRVWGLAYWIGWWCSLSTGSMEEGPGRWGRAKGDSSSLDREFKLSEGQPRIEDEEAFGYMGIW